MRLPVLLFLWTAASAQGLLTRISTPSPFPAGCDGVQHGEHYRNTTVEPWVASDPNNLQHVVGLWQQDRWSDGEASGLLTAASFDGGRSWSLTGAHFTHCSGGTADNGGDYDRASDPWSAIAPDGTAYQIALA